MRPCRQVVVQWVSYFRFQFSVFSCARAKKQCGGMLQREACLAVKRLPPVPCHSLGFFGSEFTDRPLVMIDLRARLNQALQPIESAVAAPLCRRTPRRR